MIAEVETRERVERGIARDRLLQRADERGDRAVGDRSGGRRGGVTDDGAPIVQQRDGRRTRGVRVERRQRAHRDGPHRRCLVVDRFRGDGHRDLCGRHRERRHRGRANAGIGVEREPAQPAGHRGIAGGKRCSSKRRHAAVVVVDGCAEPVACTLVVDVQKELHREAPDRRTRVVGRGEHRADRLGVRAEWNRGDSARVVGEDRPARSKRIDQRGRVRALDRPSDGERQHGRHETYQGELPRRQHVGPDERDHARDRGAGL